MTAVLHGVVECKDPSGERDLAPSAPGFAVVSTNSEDDQVYISIGHPVGCLTITIGLADLLAKLAALRN